MLARQCPHCDRPLAEDGFFPAEYGPVVGGGRRGSAQWDGGANLYSPLEVDCDPSANNLRQTPILNLEVEVHVGALRAAYPDMYDQIAASATSELSANGSIDRIARQQVYSRTGASSASCKTSGQRSRARGFNPGRLIWKTIRSSGSGCGPRIRMGCCW